MKREQQNIILSFRRTKVRRNDRKFVATKQMESFHLSRGYKYDAINGEFISEVKSYSDPDSVFFNPPGPAQTG